MINITKFAVRRPITIVLCLITIAFFGVRSLMGTKIELIPDMKLPMLIVATTYPGASPEDVNDLVVSKQEDAISTLNGIDSVQAYSQENVAVLIVSYKYGTDMDTAYINMKKAIDGIRGQLPDSIEEPNIIELDMNAQPVIMLAVSGNVQGNLHTFVDKKLVPEFQKLGAVGEVSLAGGQKQYTRIELKPERLEQYHLSMADVGRIVGAADFTIPAGEIDVGRRKLKVSAGNEYNSLERLKAVAIPLADGDIIHLSDVAEVYEALEDKTSIGRYKGEDVISIGIKKQQSATAIEVSKQVLKQIEKIRGTMPGINIEVVNDSSDIIKESLFNVVETLGIAIILSMIVLWLFYGDLRASVIVGTSIPISVVLALICMSAMGFSMNQISLTALVLGVGMMVDNSINVLDGCFRAKEKMNFYDASIEGSRTMIGSITGGTVTTCVVFLPLALLGGMSGQLFKQLGFTIVFCMVASLFSAVIIVPLCYCQWHPMENDGAPVNNIIKSMQAWYRKHIPSIIPRKGLVFMVSLSLLAAAFGLASKLNMDLMSSADEGIVNMTVKIKPGLSTAAVDETVRTLEELVISDENVDRYLLTFGSSGLDMGSSNAVTINAYLKDGRSLSTEEVVEKWRKDTQYYKDCSIKVEQGNTMGVPAAEDEITINLQGTDYDVLKAATDEVTDRLRGRQDVMQVHSSIENAAPVVKVDIDPIKAEAEGLTPSEIGSVLYNNLSGIKAAAIRVNGEEVDAKVEFAKERYNSIDKLQGMRILTASGTSLPLEDLAEIRYQDTPNQIERKNKQYQVAITMQPQAQYKKTAKKEVYTFIEDWKFPGDVEQSKNSNDESMGEEMEALGGALGTGIFLIFIVMAIQFESPKYSLMVMTTIPFSLIGSFGLLFLADSPISMVSMIGFLMLAGTVVNNGILYVDTVRQLRVNSSLESALVEAGAIRMRPILMTTLTTIISMVPNALAFGKAGAMMQGLALVNIGGLLAATVLTLVLLPTYYNVVSRMGRKYFETDIIS